MEESWCEVLALTCPDGTFTYGLHGPAVRELVPRETYMGIIEPGAREIIEPGTTETYHIIFSTDHEGPVCINAQFQDTSRWVSHAQQLLVLSRAARGRPSEQTAAPAKGRGHEN